MITRNDPEAVAIATRALEGGMFAEENARFWASNEGEDEEEAVRSFERAILERLGIALDLTTLASRYSLVSLERAGLLSFFRAMP